MRILLVIMLIIAAALFIYLNERYLERRSLRDALTKGKKHRDINMNHLKYNNNER